MFQRGCGQLVIRESMQEGRGQSNSTAPAAPEEHGEQAELRHLTSVRQVTYQSNRRDSATASGNLRLAMYEKPQLASGPGYSRRWLHRALVDDLDQHVVDHAFAQ